MLGGAICVAACLAFAAGARAAPFVYVASIGPDTVSQFDATGGLLAPLTPSSVTTGPDPYAIALTPDGHHAYVTNNAGNSVSAYTINPDGTLTSLGPTPAGINPRGIAVTPDGHHAYVTNTGGASVSAYTINPDGTLTSLGPTTPTGSFPGGIAVTPDGHHAYVTNDVSNNVSAYTINADGTLTSLGPTTPTGTTPHGIAVTPDGQHAYVTNRNSANISLYTINPDGTLTSLGPTTPTGNNPYAIAVTSDGRHTYVANLGSDTVSAYTINADGTLTGIATAPTGSGPVGIAVTPATAREPATLVHGWPRPIVTQLSQGSVDAAGGQTITIRGENFSDGSQVLFGDIPAAHMTLERFNRITATTPRLAPGVVAVRVITPAGRSPITEGSALTITQ